MPKNIYTNERELINKTAVMAGFKPEDIKDYFFSRVSNFPVLWILFKGNNDVYLDYYWEFSKVLKEEEA